MGETKRRFYLFFQICLFQIFLFNPLTLKGQEEALFFQRLSVAQNLTAQKYNYYIFKDSKGFVWISSIDGLNRFDGLEVKQYLPKPVKNDSIGLADVNIQSNFFEDKAGNLWFSTESAIQKYDRDLDEFRQYRFTKDGKPLRGDYQLHYFDTETENLWVRLEDSIYICQAGLELKPIFKDIIPHNTRRYKCKVISGNDSIDNYLLLPKYGKLEVRKFRDNNEISRIEYPKINRPGFTAHSFYYENKNNLWIGADSELVLMDLENGHAKAFDTFNGKPISNIKGIEPLGEHILIVATVKDGIYYFDKSTNKYTSQLFTNEDDKLAPFQYPINEIYLSPDNTLWISTFAKGVFYVNLEKKKFKAVLQNLQGDSTALNNIKSITEDDQGRIWCLASNGLLVLDENLNLLIDEGKYRGEGIKFAGSESSHIYCDNFENIWVGMIDDLYVLKPESEQFEKIHFNFSKTISWFTFIRNLGGEDNRLIVATQFNGLNEAIEKNGRFVLHSMPEFTDDYTLIFEDRLGTIYLGTDGSNLQICQNKNGQFIKDTLLSLPGQINGLFEDNQGNGLWIATANGLFNLAKKGDNYFLRRDNILNVQTINGMLQDDAGNLWLSSNQGLIRYNPINSNIRIFGMADGLQALEFNFWSALKTRNGKFVFGGVNGINVFDPEKINDLKIKPNPTITHFEINNELFPDYLKDAATHSTNISKINKIVLEHSQNDLSIGVAPLEFSDPTANEYYFEIVSDKDTIIREGKNNVFQYPNMQPGKYILTYNASNSDGVWFDDQEKNLEIIIKPPWWQTWWARTLGVLAILSLIYAYYRFRVAQIQKEAAYKQLVAETETAVLRLQMNPHFIFNSMNSINSYILQKDVETASNYLHRFARLMRMILKFAAQPLIAISDEIELLDLYLQTETMRFEKKFDYSFELKDDMDPDEFVIPTMILQPFVENAIWHGISNKKDGEGRIKISFWQENESFYCSVEDNGVGRIASREISQKAKTHESKALSITEHRLQLLEKKNGVTASFEIQDLTDVDKNPIGTKILLRFPLL